MPSGSNAPRGLLGDFPLGRPRADAHTGRSLSRLTEPRGHARPGSTVRGPDGACGLQQGTRLSQRGAAAARGWRGRARCRRHVTSEAAGRRGSSAPQPTGVRVPRPRPPPGRPADGDYGGSPSMRDKL